jgi:hypothetical protein
MRASLETIGWDTCQKRAKAASENRMAKVIFFVQPISRFELKER